MKHPPFQEMREGKIAGSMVIDMKKNAAAVIATDLTWRYTSKCRLNAVQTAFFMDLDLILICSV